MTTVESLYKDWLYFLAFEDEIERERYSLLLDNLSHTIYCSLNPRDTNRIYDAIDFRYRFGAELNIPREIIDRELKDHDVSVLEVMISLSFYCYENVSQYSLSCQMDTSSWFKDMLKSLGLFNMNDQNFNYDIFEERMKKFLKGDIYPNGRGGLFTVNNPTVDMRNLELWYQMNHYINEKINENN